MSHTAQAPEPTPATDRATTNPPAPGGIGRVIFTIIVLAVITLSIIQITTRRKDAADLERETLDDAIPTVAVTHPQQTPLRVEVDLPGNITAFMESPIYARASGYLKRWMVDIGTKVQTGDLLAEIDSPELDQELNQSQAALAQARANLEIARVTADRWQSLRKSDSVSQQDTDEKIAAWHARDADVKAAEASVQRLTDLKAFDRITAPFSGVITMRNLDVGTLITAGSARELFRLARIDPLRVYVSLPQIYSQVVQTNDIGTLVLAELPGLSFTGQVVRTAGAIDPVSRTLLTELDVPNQDGKLLPGSHAMVHMKINSPTVPLIVPINCLLFRGEGAIVGVVDQNSTTRLVSVMLGRDFGKTVEIVHGLSESDQVILNPSDSLEAGVKVRLTPTPENPKK
jgi:RND family efflux transporter MFP subunit